MRKDVTHIEIITEAAQTGVNYCRLQSDAEVRRRSCRRPFSVELNDLKELRMSWSFL